ncbi:MAG: HAD family phosphatase [Chitinophagaceae bacterium]|nr:MAG: HAD family phosphatase [Chitinophagaceae bacterium]
MKSSLPKIIFFDIGGVLLSNGWGHESRQASADKFGFDYEEMNHLHEFIFNVYEIGRITLDEYLDTILFYQHRSFSKDEVKSFMFSQSTELPQLLSWLIQWKQKYREQIQVMSINNEGRELNDYRIRQFGLHRLFDAFISSCEVGMRKPDPGIFRLAVGIAAVKPEECIYFDDRAFLVEAAAKTGIQSYQHKTFEATKEILEGLV